MLLWNSSAATFISCSIVSQKICSKVAFFSKSFPKQDEESAACLTDGDSSTYWESDGRQGQHWIRLTMRKGVIVKWVRFSDNLQCVPFSLWLCEVSALNVPSPCDLRSITHLSLVDFMPMMLFSTYSSSLVGTSSHEGCRLNKILLNWSHCIKNKLTETPWKKFHFLYNLKLSDKMCWENSIGWWKPLD